MRTKQRRFFTAEDDWSADQRTLGCVFGSACTKGATRGDEVFAYIQEVSNSYQMSAIPRTKQLDVGVFRLV